MSRQEDLLPPRCPPPCPLVGFGGQQLQRGFARQKHSNQSEGPSVITSPFVPCASYHLLFPLRAIMVSHKEFAGAGKQPGLQVWRIENMDLKPVPKTLHGNFFTGDAYLLLFTTSAPSYNIHMWLGENTHPGGVSGKFRTRSRFAVNNIQCEMLYLVYCSTERLNMFPHFLFAFIAFPLLSYLRCQLTYQLLTLSVGEQTGTWLFSQCCSIICMYRCL